MRSETASQRRALGLDGLRSQSKVVVQVNDKENWPRWQQPTTLAATGTIAEDVPTLQTTADERPSRLACRYTEMF
jgi:hypothetical protein